MAAHGGGGSIADVFFSAILDDHGLEAQAKSVGDRAGAALSGGLRNAMGKALLGGLSAGFAIATKGMLELQNIQAEFQAQTGATAEEAEKAGKAINRLAGSNLQSLDEVGKAFTAVVRELKVTGKEAEDTTDLVLKFAHVTGQDATTAVMALDDILDAWNLTAADSQHVLDLLITAHQEWGGSISENQDALKQLGPSLQAANFTIEDAVGFLGLFNDKGIDASKATLAFQKALTKVKSPEELKKLIQDIADTPDPFQRAAKAADLFGSRAGAKLGQALGGANLDDYTRKLDASDDALHRASDAIESTFSARVQLAIKAVTSRIVEFGQSFGPALTGLASLIALGGALGLDRVVSAAFSKLAGSRLVTGAAQRAGSAAATAYLQGLFISDKLGILLNKAWAGSGAKINAAAARAGTAAGVAFSAALGAAAIIGIALVAEDIRAQIEAQGKALSKQTAEFVETATLEELKQARAGVAEQAKQLALQVASLSQIPGLGGILANSSKEALAATQKVLDQLDAEIAKHHPFQGIAEGPGSLPAAIRDASPAARQAATDLVAQVGAITAPLGGKIVDDIDISAEIAEAKERNKTAIAEMAGALATQLAQSGMNLKGVSAELAKQLPDAIANNKEEVRRQAVLSMVQFAAGIRDTRAQIDAAVDQIGTDMENGLSAKQERIKLQGQLAGDNVTKGLKSKDPVVRAQAEGTVQLIVDRLTQLGVDASTLGGQAGKNYATALKDTKPIVQSAADSAASGQDKAFKYYRDHAHTWGYNTGKAYADGLRSTYGLVSDAFQTIASALTKGMKASSPPGPQSPLHKVDVWGENTIKAYADGLRRGISAVRGAALDVASTAGSILAPRPSYGLVGAATVPHSRFPFSTPLVTTNGRTAGAPNVINNNVTIAGLVKARDPFEVSSTMERFQRTGILSWPEEPS